MVELWIVFQPPLGGPFI